MFDSVIEIIKSDLLVCTKTLAPQWRCRVNPPRHGRPRYVHGLLRRGVPLPLPLYRDLTGQCLSVAGTSLMTVKNGREGSNIDEPDLRNLIVRSGLPDACQKCPQMGGINFFMLWGGFLVVWTITLVSGAV